MRATPLSLPGELVFGVSPGSLWKDVEVEVEPTSVLDTRASPSPPTSTSTLSGGGGDSAGVAAVSDSSSYQWQDVAGGEWAAAELLHPGQLEVIGGEKCGIGMEDCWADVLAGAAPPPPAAGMAAVAGQEHSFFRWFMGDMDDPSPEPAMVVDTGFGFDPPSSKNPATSADFVPFNITSSVACGGMVSPTSSTSDVQCLRPAPMGMSSPVFGNSGANAHPINLSLPPSMFYQEPPEEKAMLFNNQQNQSFFFPLPFNHQDQQQQHLFLPPNPKRHQPAPPFFTPQSRAAPIAGKQTKPVGDEASAAVVEQLVKAWELVDSGNSVHARGILARLNHHLPSPVGKLPLLRAGYYFAEALRRLLDPSTAGDDGVSGAGVVFKIAAYKVFSEISPVLQFSNFTANQALLEAVGGHSRLHILDFDVGLGGQWSSFIKELAGPGAALPGGPPSLKITSFLPASAATADLLELELTRDNLVHFAAELNIPFDFRVAAADSLDPSITGDGEAIAVNLPTTPRPPPALLRFLKQLKPKLVVCLDRSAGEGDLLRSLHSHAALLDSLDAASPNSDALHKIERFLLAPRINKLLTGRHCLAGDKTPPLCNALAAAGFSPAAISSFAETQAECLVKKMPVKGFHVEKRPPAALSLCWQRSELAAVSAWRC